MSGKSGDGSNFEVIRCSGGESCQAERLSLAIHRAQAVFLTAKLKHDYGV